MIKDFIFNDIVLYAKGWYQRSENIVDDLGYLFSKIYGWQPTTEKEVADFMVRVLDKLYEQKEITFKADSNMHCFTGFHNEVNRRMSIYNVSYNRAVILLVLSELQQLSVDEIKLKAPHFGKKEHFRMGMLFGEWPKSMTYKEMNKRAQKAFNR